MEYCAFFSVKCILATMLLHVLLQATGGASATLPAGQQMGWKTELTALSSSLLDKDGNEDGLLERTDFGDGAYTPELPFALSASLAPLSELYPDVLEQPLHDEMDINEGYSLIDALYQGDIFLPESTASREPDKDGPGAVRNRRASTNVLSRLWPLGVIPYKIHSDLHHDGRRMFAILAALDHWRMKTCLRFIPRSDQEDFIEFQDRDGCWSSIGRRGGPQVLSVGSRCGKVGIVVHEIGHVVGLWHEHSRPDRDEHITIRWEHIEPQRFKNFAKSTGDKINSLGTPYDIGSIMHYGARSFGQRNPRTGVKLTTIELVNAFAERNGKMGQRLALSLIDIQQVNMLYRCNKEERIATSCHDHMVFFGERVDGTYNISISNCSKPLEVHCHGMGTESPKTFITLSPSTHTYSHYYGPRLVGGVAEQGCAGRLRRDEWKQKGVTLFFRVRLDTASLVLVQDDYTFTYSFGKPHRLGWAGDCFSRLPNCRRGALQVDLEGSGVQFDGKPFWYMKGEDASHNLQLESDWLVRGNCGGWCGQCRLRNIRIRPDEC